MIQIGMVESWSEFATQNIEISPDIRISATEFVNVLLRYLTSEGHRSIYDVPIKENYAEKESEVCKTYISSQRGFINLIYRFFQSKKFMKSRQNIAELN